MLTSRKPKPWYEQDNGGRLAQDQALIAKVYPGLSFHLDNRSGQYFLHGILAIRAECGVPTKIEVRIEFPDNYPQTEPQAFDAANQFPHVMDRHFISNGQCCLWLPPRSQWDKHDTNALVSFIDQVVLFFERQLICDALGGNTWPGEEYSHGIEGYLQYIQETLRGDRQLVGIFIPLLTGTSTVKRNAKCPWNSGFKYKRCHLKAVEEIIYRVSPEVVKLVIEKVSTESTVS